MDPRADGTTTGDGPDAVAVIVGPGARNARAILGPVAWCALEVLAATPADDGDDAWVVSGSVRTVAAHMGVAKNTAQRALTALRKSGLVTSIQRRGRTGEFAAGAYRLDVDADVLSRQPRTPPAVGSQTVQSRRLLRKVPVEAKAIVEIGQQLVLIPSV
jgi:DNA-binding transcriptional ArsR family regulator